MEKTGKLYIVATPIGNLSDMTYRAVEILGNVSIIAAEDTRHSKVLLQHYGIKTSLISLHEFNETRRISTLLNYLTEGKDVALISDAGTPLISDPGIQLVKLLRNEGIQIVPVPGPCAVIAALCASGVSTDRFVFEGFLSTKAGRRAERLEALSNDDRTIVFYEAPHRILKFIEDLKDNFDASREIVLAKELTKTFEAFISGSADEISDWLKEDERRQKGEFVVLISAMSKDKKDKGLPAETIHILETLLSELSVKQAVEMAAKITGSKKNLIYQYAISKKE